MNTQTDEQLVTRVQSGDVSAFETLVKRYQRRLYSFIVHIVSDEHLAEEVAADSLFSIYKSIDRVDTTKKFYSYVFAIAKNTAISRLRQKKTHVRLDDIEHVAAEDESMYEELIIADRYHHVRSAILKLEEKYRNVIRLYYFNDLSYEEIGKKLHMPVNTVRTHLLRAKKLLGEILKKYEIS